MTFTATRPAASEANTIEAGTYRLRCLAVGDPYVADNYEKTEQVWQCDITWSIEGDMTGEETDFDGMEINQRFVKCGYLPKNVTLTPGTPAIPGQNFKLVTDDRATFTKVVNALLGTEWEELNWTDLLNRRLVGEVVLKENGYPKITSFLALGKKKTAKPAAPAAKAKAAPVVDDADEF